jgi:hypothetical protein
MLTYQKEKEQVLAIPESISPEERFQQQRMRDVMLLLENLAAQEEATIKLIIDCLYDVGSINIINKKIPHPSANKIVKWIAVTSKPIFRIIAWRWVRKNLSLKVTNWLARKVSFK